MHVLFPPRASPVWERCCSKCMFSASTDFIIFSPTDEASVDCHQFILWTFCTGYPMIGIYLSFFAWLSFSLQISLREMFATHVLLHTKRSKFLAGAHVIRLLLSCLRLQSSYILSNIRLLHLGKFWTEKIFKRHCFSLILMDVCLLSVMPCLFLSTVRVPVMVSEPCVLDGSLGAKLLRSVMHYLIQYWCLCALNPLFFTNASFSSYSSSYRSGSGMSTDNF